MQEQEEQLNSKNLYTADEFPLIPKEAFLYFPTEAEQLNGQGVSGIRRIFEGQIDFNDFEFDQLDAFDALLEKQNKTLSNWWDDSKKLRFLYANKFNLQKSLDSMEVHTQWRAESLPPKPTDIARELLENGAMYLHGHDNRFRPIIVLDISKLKSGVPLEEIFSGMTYFFEHILEKVFIPGQIENWIVVLDLKKYGATQLPVKNLKGLMSYLSNNYRSRMYKCYIINSTWTITGVWKMVKQFLTQNTIDKIIFENDIPKGLFNHAHPSQIEEQYGGTAPNKTTPYWPPQRISETFWLPSDSSEQILIKDEKYLKMYDQKILNYNKVCLNYVIGCPQFNIVFSYAKKPQFVNEKDSKFEGQGLQDHAKNMRNGGLVVKSIKQENNQSTDKIQIDNFAEHF